MKYQVVPNEAQLVKILNGTPNLSACPSISFKINHNYFISLIRSLHEPRKNVPKHLYDEKYRSLLLEKLYRMMDHKYNEDIRELL
jgi:hypothetical protein